MSITTTAINGITVFQDVPSGTGGALINNALTALAGKFSPVLLFSSGVPTGYATPALAQTAAASGDTIGIYANFTLTTRLGKDGVNYYVAPGVTLSNATTSVWGDNNSAMTFNVYGDGTFTCSLTLTPTVYLQHASSVMHMTARRVNQTATGNSPAFRLSGTSIVHLSDGSYSTTYDAWWAEAGDHEIHAPNLIGGTNSQANGVECWDVTRARVFATKITGRQAPVRFDNTPLNVYIECHEMAVTGAGTMGLDFGTAVLNTAGQITIRADKISGNINYANENVTSVLDAITIIGARIDASANATAGAVVTDSNGFLFVDCRIIANSSDVAIYSAGATVAVSTKGDFVRNKALGAGVTVTALSASNP